MELIQSRDNQLIKDIKKLKDRKNRDRQGEFFIEGYRFVEEAFKSGAKIEKLLISEAYLHRYRDTSLTNYNAPEYVLKESLFDDICSTETPQGIAAVVKKSTCNINVDSGIFILVDKVQDPGNLGTIIRTAHAAGIKGIICTAGTVDPYNDKSLRSTMGSIFYIPIIEDKDLSKIKEMKSRGFRLVVSSLEAKEDFYNISYGEKLIIAVGNEGQGISEDIANLSDIKVKIPMPGGAESLNVSVAAAVMIYEVLRQKLK